MPEHFSLYEGQVEYLTPHGGKPFDIHNIGPRFLTITEKAGDEGRPDFSAGRPVRPGQTVTVERPIWLHGPDSRVMVKR